MLYFKERESMVWNESS